MSRVGGLKKGVEEWVGELKKRGGGGRGRGGRVGCQGERVVKWGVEGIGNKGKELLVNE